MSYILSNFFYSSTLVFGKLYKLVYKEVLSRQVYKLYKLYLYPLMMYLGTRYLMS